MNKRDVKKLKHGIYVIHWKKSQGGGQSLAAIGSQSTGKKWLA